MARTLCLPQRLLAQTPIKAGINSEEQAEIDVAALQTDIDALEREWAQARDKMRGYLAELSLFQ